MQQIWEPLFLTKKLLAQLFFLQAHFVLLLGIHGFPPGMPYGFFISRGAEGPGREILKRPPSVRPSVRLSVTFSFRTVTQKRIDVFDGMLFEFFMNFLNIERNKIFFFFFFFNISCFLRVSCYFQH